MDGGWGSDIVMQWWHFPQSSDINLYRLCMFGHRKAKANLGAVMSELCMLILNIGLSSVQ